MERSSETRNDAGGVMLMLVLALGACAPRGGREPAAAASDQLAGARQLVLVVTPAWDSVGATLRRFERDGAGGSWRAVAAPVPAVVGRTGLAWGSGLLPAAGERARLTGPVKREGDGRAPAGAFRLGAAFGFAPADSVPWVRMPYRQVTGDLECVDDTASRHYNRLVSRAGAVPMDWSSSERMRTIQQYRFGLVVDHNAGAGDTGAPRPGGGSCIFLHIWGTPAAPAARPAGTAGCTAFSPDEIVALLRWIDPAAAPVLVQLPESEYGRRRGEWGLP